jgi:haloalkane dehalogenase
MDFLRTPDERFANLPDYDFVPHYVEILGGRMQYVDTEAGTESLLMLHGEPSWSFLYRHVINALKADYRCIAPDMLGFGRSDKPSELSDHSFDFHYQALSNFVEALDLQNITLVVQDWGGLLGLPYAAHHPERIKRLVIMNTGLATGDIDLGEGFHRWREFVKRIGTSMEAGQVVALVMQEPMSEAVKAAYEAPFPDESYRAGIASMPLLVPINPEMGGAALSREAREIFKSWQKPTLVMFSDKDPVTAGGDRFFRKLIPSAKDQPEITIEGIGHFLQEEAGEEIAAHLRDFMRRT